MSTKFSLTLASFFIFVFSSIAAEKPGKIEVNYETLEEAYSIGRCNDYENIYNSNKRDVALLFIQDVMYGAIGYDSYSNDIVGGNISTFRIGRSPDEVIVKLYGYAKRHDVRKLIINDSKSVKEQISTNRKESDDAVSLATFCELYLAFSGGEYLSKADLHGYYDSLHERVTQANLNNLQNILDAEN